ncbi:MAG: hypothetical protein UY23_C0003G0029 [Candidatus Jorgensenbacteria bacterium GW2011_GWA1_48_11]|uniref:GGDEF domain-containing protein n=1 Tax=Candidatus Jorgensenbacteria bacterium GW2011_GWA1_48_11 TaxID=1618660 RepID=A0A0G1UAI4_9BACT|nr:MAG: hypothetical protein UY23_C0003G0029 [Candidatus Jorgensenbacteria bacterium GW2011_GWA1_48_11]KKW11867.1 MAG: hypothetical protein UY51_C0005G0108 [Candidatus Jorgensenbacteria bacterium GW2011_GWB1_49_9]
MTRTEIQKLKKEIKRLKELAYKDELTGLFNRHGFKEEARKFVSAVVRFGRTNKRKSFLVKNFGLIVFDIDDFKKLNDAYGHLAGDLVLKSLSRFISRRVRDSDIVARWGGEEIIVGLVGASESDAFGVAENIRRGIAGKELNYNRRKINLSVSGGVADMVKIGDFEKLFDRADKALYRAKKLGKNRIILYSDL